MSKRLQLLTVLAAWFLATGAQWDFVQVAGWSRMFAGYAHTMSLPRALVRTFNGEMCGVCRAVDQARHQADNSPALPDSGQLHAKFLAIFQPASTAIPFRVRAGQSWVRIDRPIPARDREAPPLPPPRLIAA